MKQETFYLLVDLIMSEAETWGNRNYEWNDLIQAMGTLGELNPEHYPYKEMQKLTQAKFEHEAELEDQSKDFTQDPMWLSKYEKEERLCNEVNHPKDKA